MIIDSHAHYAHERFAGEFPYLCKRDGAYAVAHGTPETLLCEMQQNGIVGTIEASIGYEDLDGQMALGATLQPYMRTTVGVHPTRCIHTDWKNRKKLRGYVQSNHPVAIGETGLDYHHPRKEQRRLRQKMWFRYQLKLADELALPLVLHIRKADADALRILKANRKRLHGGVVHCFTGDAELANQYIALGLCIGIGGKLLWDNEEGREICEAVKSIPLSSILVETDAPFVLPDTGDLQCSKNQRRRLCNSSLILPDVIRKIAELRGEAYETVESAIYQNTLRLFRLTDPN
ncbi:MAG: TatD family hydrolase [Clostridia bacterium]|nr:TatD family hydrolase [Clostridia bacterium]